MLRERDPSRATVIEQWVEGIATSYTCLPMDVASFRLWARLTARRADRLALDAMIAATALTRGLIVATRNVRDFRALGVPTVNPFRARG
jgi:predicted nucleic acid-binding protein